MSSEVDKKLIAEFQRDNPGKNAIWHGKITQQFQKWLNRKEKGKNVSSIGKIKGIEKYKPPKKKAKKVSKKSPTSAIVKLENRVGLLEEQVKYLMSKLGGVEVKLANEKAKDTIYSSKKIDIVKNRIKSRVLPGDSITIDDLTQIKELQKFSLSLLERAVNELIDDEIFDASEGYSVQKINGKIGLLIRR